MDDYRKTSVIIPVYNCEKYLSKCLQSIVEQSYVNIEIIVVDDGSTDASRHICDLYARQDDRVKVLYQMNAGPGAARNAALEIMTGDYITYIDADDYVAKDYVETMVELLNNYGADIAEVGFVRMLQARNDFDCSDGSVLCFDGPDFLIKDYFSKEKRVRNCAGGRMYVADRFKDIRYSEKLVGEDSEYSLKMLAKCRRLVKYNKCLYVCRAYQESLTRGTLVHRHFDVVDIFYRDFMFAQKLDIELDDWKDFFNSFTKVCYGLLEKIALQKKEKEFTSELKNMTLIFHKISQLAIEHGVILSKQLEQDIESIDKWAKIYRRKNCLQILIKRIRHCISGTMAFCKVKLSYEYKI